MAKPALLTECVQEVISPATAAFLCCLSQLFFQLECCVAVLVYLYCVWVQARESLWLCGVIWDWSYLYIFFKLKISLFFYLRQTDIQMDKQTFILPKSKLQCYSSYSKQNTKMTKTHNKKMENTIFYIYIYIHALYSIKAYTHFKHEDMFLIRK